MWSPHVIHMNVFCYFSSIEGYTEINDDSVATECGYATTRSVRNVGYPGRTGENPEQTGKYPGRAESLDPYSECGEEYVSLVLYKLEKVPICSKSVQGQYL